MNLTKSMTPKTNKYELPLYPIFETLRKNGFSLGINDYYDLLSIMQAGGSFDKKNGRLDKYKTMRVCKTLWLKPNQSEFVFESIFNEHYFDIYNKSENETVNPESNYPEKTPIEENETHDLSDQKIDKQEKERKTILPKDKVIPQEEKSNNLKFPYVKLIMEENAGENIELYEENAEITRKFLFLDNYMSLSKRKMQQIWCFLPIFHYTDDKSRIDINKTVQELLEKQSLSSILYSRKREANANVVLLTDHKGSMIAFEKQIGSIFSSLKATIESKSILRYYFYNTIQDYLYKNTSHTKYVETVKVINKLNINSVIIIVSDAGTARGNNSGERFKSSIRSYIRFSKKSPKIIWLNPMPKERWKNTTAERISRIIPMFCINTYNDLQNAVKTLRGKNY